MRHVTEREITLSGKYQDVFGLCVQTLQSISPGPTYDNFTLEYANAKSGKIRAVSSQFSNSWYVFVAEIAVTAEDEGCLVHALMGVDGISLTDFGWTRKAIVQFIGQLATYK